MFRWGIFAGLVLLFAGLAEGQQTQVSLLPAIRRVAVDSPAVVRVSIGNVRSLHAYSVRVTYDPLIVRCVDARGLQFFGPSSFLFRETDSTRGFVQVEEALLGPGGRSGSGDLLEISFVGIRAGTTPVQIAAADCRDTVNAVISVISAGGEIQVGPVTAVAASRATEGEELTVSNYPNPFNSATIFRFTLPAGSPATFRVYSILGVEVFSERVPDDRAAVRSVSWDGRDRAGKSVPSGMYVVRVETEKAAAARKIVLVR